MPTLQTEDFHTGEYLVSEANGNLSREVAIVLTGQVLKAGHVIGRTLTGGAGLATAYAGNTGNGAMGTITVSGRALIGTYRLTIIEPATDAGIFVIEDPKGVEIGRGNVASAFSGGGLAFTLADGATNFVAGDGFTIAVTGTEKWKEHNIANTDGSEIARAVLFEAVDATDADKNVTMHRRNAEVNGHCLTWFSGATDDNKAAGSAQLRDNSEIIVRY